MLGLLRSHADILRALHRLGAGVGDPAAPGGAGSATAAAGHDPAGHDPAAGPGGRRSPAPLLMGPPLPGERSSTTAPDVAGVTPSGDARSVRVTGVEHRTLLAFLSSGCATCAGIWEELADPVGAGLPADVRVVAVTKGPELEISGEVARRAPDGLLVLMSTGAWGDYEVPGSPFFVLIDGPAGRRAGEGVANRLFQVAELVRRATVDGGAPAGPGEPGAREATGRAGEPAGGRTRSRAFAAGLDGKAREAQNDAELAAAGILPGDASLYPSALGDLFAPAGGPNGAHGRTPTAPPAAGERQTERQTERQSERQRHTTGG